MPKNWRYFEGTTSANSILKDLGKVFTTAVKDDEIRDAEGELVKAKKVIIERNWDIVYPPVDKTATELRNVVDWNDLSPDEFERKIENQLNRVGSMNDNLGETVILKTKTTPAVLTENSGMSDLGLEDDLAQDSITMYLELYKPKYLASPEKYNPECERFGIKPYNITRKIYEEYASTTGHKEIDVFEEYHGQPGVVLNYPETSVDKAAFSIDTRTIPANPAGDTDITKASRLALQTFGIGVTTNFNGNLSWNAWSTEVEVNTLSEAEKAALSSQYAITNIDEYNKVRFAIDYQRNTYGDKVAYMYYIKAKFTKVRETYRLTSGTALLLPDAATIKASTVVLKDNSGPLTGSFTYNIATGEITITRPIPGTADGDFNETGRIVIEYDYEKEQAAITGRKLLYNNHYIYTRIFDKIEDRRGILDRNGNEMYLKAPKANEVDRDTGEVVQLNSHVSEWSKLAWYQDYEEVMADELDSDVGIADLSQGVVLLPVETPGLNGDTRIRMWINSNNDRNILVLMGNPSLDFSANRHLTSMCYIGRIESFENSINDTAGNFALLTSSSTVPCSTQTIERTVSLSAESSLGFASSVGGSPMRTFSIDLSRLYPNKNVIFDENMSFAIKYIDPSTDAESATIQENAGVFTKTLSSDKKSSTITIDVPPVDGTEIILVFNYIETKLENIDGIVRDTFGNILDIRYPETWGKNTATGVTDVCMLHTRSKAYFQKHHFMFTTTEEYMTKEMYGKSAYTGEYYADRVKITHGNDGPRGMLADMLVIDQSSLVALDELIVNREFSKDVKKPEETYVYFPINAPFSPFAGSPNAMYGIAVKKDHKLQPSANDEEAVDRVLADLYIGKLTNVTEDIYLPTEGEEEVSISWSSDDATVVSVEELV